MDWYKPDLGTVVILCLVIAAMFRAAIGDITLEVNDATISNNIYVVIIGVSGLLFLAVDILWDYIAYGRK